MKLTVIGCCGPYPSEEVACSGYMLESGGIKVLIDMGSGVLSLLQKYIQPESLDAIILTHLHSDHISDLFVYRYFIQLAMKSGLIKKPVMVYGPQSPVQEYEMIKNSGQYINYQTISDGDSFNIGKINFIFLKTMHPVECYAVKAVVYGEQLCKIASRKRSSILYTGDTGAFDKLTSFAEGVDILIADSCFLSREKTGTDMPHMTALECGKLADRACVGRLVLTHFRPGRDIEEFNKEASAFFKNTCSAFPGLSIELNDKE